MKRQTVLGFLLVSSSAIAQVSPSDWLYNFASGLNWTENVDGGACGSLLRSILQTTYPTSPKSHLKYIASRTFVSDNSRDDTKNIITSYPIIDNSVSFVTPWQMGNGIVSRLLYSTDTAPYIYNMNIINNIDDNGITGSTVCVNILVYRK